LLGSRTLASFKARKDTLTLELVSSSRAH